MRILNTTFEFSVYLLYDWCVVFGVSFLLAFGLKKVIVKIDE